MAEVPPAAAPKKLLPSLSARRLLLVSTGTASTSFLPFWLNWLRDNYADLEVKVVLTRSAERFVTPQAVSLLNGRPVLHDAWPDEPAPAAMHVALAEWADAIGVFPASAHFIARFALGICDTPVTLALQCSKQVIGVAPSVPPGLTGNPVHEGHLRALSERTNVVVTRTTVGRSATTGRYDQGVVVPMWELIELIEARRAAIAAGLQQENGMGSDGRDTGSAVGDDPAFRQY